VNEEKVKNKSQPKSKEEQGPRISINNTLYLNTSSNYQSLNIDNGPNINGSFDMKNDLESLNKKFGNNISFIHNNVNNNNNKQNEANQLEMEDILLKMVLEEGEQKKAALAPQETNVLVENTNYLANRLNTSFENNRKKQSTSVYQPSSKVDESKKKKEEINKTNTSFQQNSSFVNESKMDKTFNAICCLHEEELKKAKQKIDHLTKKMKLITEENKVPTIEMVFSLILL